MRLFSSLPPRKKLPKLRYISVKKFAPNWKMKQSAFLDIERKMRDHGISNASIAAFMQQYAKLVAGAPAFLAESDIEPVRDDVLDYHDLDVCADDVDEHRKQIITIKLNGGLGTSMGLDKAKSLLPVTKEESGLTFLDVIALQAAHARVPLLMLMNSFSTSEDTMVFLRSRYPSLAIEEMLQSKVPKIATDTLLPVSWEKNPALEWCPPGHGDF